MRIALQASCCVLCLSLAVSLRAQTSPSQDGASAAGAKQQTPSATTKASPSQYAFPGESDVPKVNDDGTLSPVAAATPEAPKPAASGTSTDGASTGPGLQDAGSSGSSSSPSSSSSSSSGAGNDAATPDAAPDGTPPGDAAPAPKRGRKKLPLVARQTPDERETEDVQVGQFYMNDNNFKAAYLRAKDAISLADDDWEAHLLLADAARKMGKLDEAQTQYMRVLQLDPTPKGKKSAQAALKEMGGGGGGDTLMP
jgi:hypothetical protein